MMKVCTKCKIEKSETDYYKGRNNKLRSFCIDCHKKYYNENKDKYKKLNEKWREENKEHCKIYGKKYRELNSEKIKIKKNIYMKDYYKNNKDKIKNYRELNSDAISEYGKQYGKKYRNDNCEKISISQKEWKKKNKEKLNNYEKKRRKSDINIKIKSNLRNRIIEVLKRNSVRKNNKTFELIGCDLQTLKQHLESQFTDGMNWDNHGIKGWHIDHIRPCASFDLTNPEEQKKCFHYTNLQPLWAKDNLKKGAKIL